MIDEHNGESKVGHPEQNEEKKARNPFADMGLVVAMTLLIVCILRTLIFGLSWEDSFFIVLSCAYCFVSYRFDSETPIIKKCTTGYLAVAVLSLVAIVAIDRKPQPKMHAFEGAKTDTVAEEQFIQKEQPKLPEIDSDSVVVKDTVVNEEEVTDAPAEGEGTQEETTAPADQPAENTQE